MSPSIPHIAIIGAGITGLTAAFTLQKIAHDKQRALEITLLESSPRTGGKIQTLHHDDFLLDMGPDSFYPQAAMLDLIRTVGLEPQLIYGPPHQAYIYQGNRLLPIPRGMVLGVPTKFGAFLRSPLFSAGAKMRIALEVIGWAHPVAGDESVGAFFQRRFGKELVERLIEPLFSAIYAEDVKRLSAGLTIPRLIALQSRQRSLILGLRRARAQSLQPGARATAPATLVQGMQALTDALAAQLPAARVRRRTAVQAIQQVDQHLRIMTDTATPLDVDAIILATPSAVAAQLLDMASAFAPLHVRQPTSVASIALCYRPGAVNKPPAGTGFIVARQSGRTLTACTWSHMKWPHSTPGGRALLRCHVGRPGSDAIVEADDGAIVQSVRHDLAHIMAIDAQPDFYTITRWHKAMPHYGVGHLQHVAQIRRAVLARFPAIQLAGAPYGGPGISSCVHDGEQAARATLEHLLESQPC